MIVMWCCFGFSVLSIVALVLLWSTVLTVPDADSWFFLVVFSVPFFFVLGLNSLFWARSRGWILRIQRLAARIWAIVGVIVALAIASFVAVFTLIFGAFYLFLGIASVS
jgi:hypothetical protein